MMNCNWFDLKGGFDLILKVPFNDKNKAKEMKCRWNPELKCWSKYCPWEHLEDGDLIHSGGFEIVDIHIHNNKFIGRAHIGELMIAVCGKQKYDNLYNGSDNGEDDEKESNKIIKQVIRNVVSKNNPLYLNMKTD